MDRKRSAPLDLSAFSYSAGSSSSSSSPFFPPATKKAPARTCVCCSKPLSPNGSCSAECSPEQIAFLHMLDQKEPLFLTGGPGTGKTFVTGRFVDLFQERGGHVVVMAPTAKAACVLGEKLESVRPTTIHAVTGAPVLSGESDGKLYTEEWKNPKVRGKMISCVREHFESLLGSSSDAPLPEDFLLVIDEVSLVPDDLLAVLDLLFREVASLQPFFSSKPNVVAGPDVPRQRAAAKKLPFGGLRVLLVGDANQLMPVKRNHLFCQAAPGSFSPFFRRAFFVDGESLVPRVPKNTVFLTHSVRHSGDVISDPLRRMALAESEDELLGVAKMLNTRVVTGAFDTDTHIEQDYVFLSIRRDTVNKINQRLFGRIDSRPVKYLAEDWGKPSPLLGEMAPKVVVLKKGAKVIVTRNVSGSDKLFNGAQGVVTGLKGKEVQIELMDRERTLVWVKKMTYEVHHNSRVIARRKQIPLKLGYASTIHSAQGMTISNVIIDNNSNFPRPTPSRPFGYGLMYVAISRCPSLSGVNFTHSLSPGTLRTHPDAGAYQRLLAQKQEQKGE